MSWCARYVLTELNGLRARSATHAALSALSVVSEVCSTRARGQTAKLVVGDARRNAPEAEDAWRALDELRAMFPM